MSSRDLSDILLDLINDKTIDAVVERLRARALGENSVAESTVDSLASMWRKNLSAMKSHGAEEGSAGARADASAAAAWRLAETVEPLPADRAQGCRSAPHRTAKRPRGHSGSVRGSFYGFLKRSREAPDAPAGMTQNRMRRLEAEALQQPLFRLASPPLFPAFHGCAVQIVSVLAAEAVAPELCRVCQMVPERGRVLVRRADGAEFEVDWRDSVDDGTVEPDYRPATSGPNQSAAGSTDISRLLFLDSDSDGDGDGASAATDAQAAADAAKGLTEIWSLLQSCGVNSTQAILGESPSAKGRELSAARREAEAVALAEAEAHFRRLHTSSKVVVRLESSVAPVPDARIIAVDDDVPVDMCIVGDCVKNPAAYSKSHFAISIFAFWAARGCFQKDFCTFTIPVWGEFIVNQRCGYLD